MGDYTPFHLKLKESTHAHSPSSALGILAATHAIIVHPEGSVADLQWRSRAHRKRRYRTLDPSGTTDRRPENIWTKLGRFGKLEWRELSWWIAVFFTFGSIVWVINGFLVFLPEVNPEKYSLDDIGAGWTAWLGATIFEFGAVTALVEAMNRDDHVDFGGDVPLEHSPNDEERNLNGADTKEKQPSTRRRPTKKLTLLPLNSQLWHEIGFIASFVQFWAATIFWISGWTGIPEILMPIKEQSTRLEDGVYWTPQVIGGSGFVIASVLYMIENQQKWWKLAPFSLGWHVGFWNLIGAVGFTLCGIFGYSRFVPADGSSNWATYQSTCSTFWGGWAFLIGSLVQWWEAVQPANPHQKEASDDRIVE